MSVTLRTAAPATVSVASTNDYYVPAMMEDRNLYVDWILVEGFEAGVRLALQAVLLSPHFVFRVELDPDPTSHPLTDHERASRLSYFL